MKKSIIPAMNITFDLAQSALRNNVRDFQVENIKQEYAKSLVFAEGSVCATDEIKIQYNKRMFDIGSDILINEDDLPEMTNEEYKEWFKESSIVDGVRMGRPFVK